MHDYTSTPANDRDNGSSMTKGVGIGCLVSGLIFSGIALFVMLFFGCFVIGCVGAITESSNGHKAKRAKTTGTPVDEVPSFKEVWSRGFGDKKSPKVIRIDLVGEITGERRTRDIFSDGDGTDAMTVLDKIHAATADDEVRGIYLVLNTPGGEVTASDIIRNALDEFQLSETNRFVFVHMLDLCCSGGYYIASGADEIMAHPTTWTGSIGVILGTYNAAGLAEKIGVTSVAITSGNNKNLLDPLQPTNAEHIAIFKAAVDQAYDRFVSLVSEGRDMDEKKVRELADGRIYTANDAKKNGLIDSIGYEDDALLAVAELAHANDAEKKDEYGLDDFRLYRYEVETSLSDLFGSSLLFENSGRALKRAQHEMRGAATPSLLYLAR